MKIYEFEDSKKEPCWIAAGSEEDAEWYAHHRGWKSAHPGIKLVEVAIRAEATEIEIFDMGVDAIVRRRPWLMNQYAHQACGVAWESEWDCACNDECPTCGAEIEPYCSYQLQKPSVCARRGHGSPIEVQF
jgi:hypothetical protein